MNNFTNQIQLFLYWLLDRQRMIIEDRQQLLPSVNLLIGNAESDILGVGAAKGKEFVA